MIDVVWLAAWVAVTVAGAVIVRTGRSRLWVAAGIAYILGGIGATTYAAAEVTGAIDRPAQGSADDVAVWFAPPGFLALLVATVLTLVAIGPRGRRRFLILFAAGTLAVATYQFWTTNWVVRFGDVASYCFDAGYAPAERGIQRVPPGAYCSEPAIPLRDEVFVPADGISWLALGGSSAFYGFAASFPLMGFAWVARRRPALAPAQPPGTTR